MLTHVKFGECRESGYVTKRFKNGTALIPTKLLHTIVSDGQNNIVARKATNAQIQYEQLRLLAEMEFANEILNGCHKVSTINIMRYPFSSLLTTSIVTNAFQKLCDYCEMHVDAGELVVNDNYTVDACTNYLREFVNDYEFLTMVAQGIYSVYEPKIWETRSLFGVHYSDSIAESKNGKLTTIGESIYDVMQYFHMRNFLSNDDNSCSFKRYVEAEVSKYICGLHTSIVNQKLDNYLHIEFLKYKEDDYCDITSLVLLNDLDELSRLDLNIENPLKILTDEYRKEPYNPSGDIQRNLSRLFQRVVNSKSPSIEVELCDYNMTSDDIQYIEEYARLRVESWDSSAGVIAVRNPNYLESTINMDKIVPEYVKLCIDSRQHTRMKFSKLNQNTHPNREMIKKYTGSKYREEILDMLEQWGVPNADEWRLVEVVDRNDFVLVKSKYTTQVYNSDLEAKE